MFNGMIRNLHKEDKESIENIFALYWPDQEFRVRLSMRLQSAIDQSPECIEQDLRYLIAEKDNEVVGVFGFRKAPEHMLEFSSTKKPAEFYILAVKYRKIGIGKKLLENSIEILKNLGYTEAILYSGETHSESWGFYDHMGLKRVKSAIAPNGELGQIWRKELV